MFAFLLGIYLGVELFGKSIHTCSILADTAKQFSKVVVTKDIFLSFLNLLDPEGKGCRGKQKFGWQCQQVRVKSNSSLSSAIVFVR